MVGGLSEITQLSESDKDMQRRKTLRRLKHVLETYTGASSQLPGHEGHDRLLLFWNALDNECACVCVCPVCVCACVFSQTLHGSRYPDALTQQNSLPPYKTSKCNTLVDRYAFLACHGLARGSLALP